MQPIPTLNSIKNTNAREAAFTKGEESETTVILNKLFILGLFFWKLLPFVQFVMNTSPNIYIYIYEWYGYEMDEDMHAKHHYLAIMEIDTLF